MSNSPNQKSIYTKIFLFLAIVSFLVTSSFSSFPLFTNQEVQCYHDIGHETFSTINDAVIKSENYKNALLIISGIFTDFLFIVFVFDFILYNSSWCGILHFFTFYFLKGIFSNFFSLSQPTGYALSYPGLPSLLISYKTANDFFFSTQVGFPLISGYHLKLSNWYGAFHLGILCSLIIAFTQITIRGSYTVDLVWGIVMSHYSGKVAIFVSSYFDTSYSLSLRTSRV